MAVSLDSYSDIEDTDVDSLTESFNKAAEHVKKLVSNLDQPKLLEIYSYYKQATEGVCNIPRPRWYEMQAKAKWDAWNSLGSMFSEDAKKKYITLISELDAEFNPSADVKLDKTESWITVSSLVNTDEVLNESDKTIFDYAKEGNLMKLRNLVNNNLSITDIKDEDGLGLLHWAADRGNSDIIKYLIDMKIDVNMIDNDGQTALHYAASCGHLECVKYLINAGANRNIEDSDGIKPVDLASDSNILELLR